MKTLLCVGGEFDGETAEVAHGEWRVRKTRTDPVPTSWQTQWLQTGGAVAQKVCTVSAIYTLRGLYIRGDCAVEYLAPEDWSDEQAIKHRFSNV